MANDHFDIIVIGSGPGGEGAAMQAVKTGKRVAMIEEYQRVGGGCTHWGTIPSKALRHQVAELQAFNANPLLAGVGKIKPSISQFMRAATSVINKQVKLRGGFYFRNDVPIFHGHARFTDAHTLEVLGSEPGHPTETLTADSFVIATGSRPFRPANVDFEHPRIFDSDKILSLHQDLHSMTIYGAGVIGCEYASIFRGMGLKLNLVNTRANLLDFLDDEISDALTYHLRNIGVLIHHDESYERIEGREDCVILHLTSGKKLKSDVFLWANGRSGNTDDLGLETVGIVPNKRGHIPVNENYQTSCPHVYAVGDVVGPPGLASASYDQGRFAAIHRVEGRCEFRLVKHIPTGIYTNPEISSLGATERQLTEQKVPYEVGHSFFKSIARAQITGQTTGMLKLLFHRETLQIYGIHCFGDQAAEIISIGQAIMGQKGEANTLLYFANTTFNYPTMAEAYRVAALNGLNRLF